MVYVFIIMGPSRRSEMFDKTIKCLEIYCSFTIKWASATVEPTIVGIMKET